jgi:hypothetical protein
LRRDEGRLEILVLDAGRSQSQTDEGKIFLHLYLVRAELGNNISAGGKVKEKNYPRVAGFAIQCFIIVRTEPDDP